MDNNNSISKIIEMMYEIKETVSALNERSKSYYDIQHEHTENIKAISSRLTIVEADTNELKRDRWWVGIIITFTGSLIAAIISIIIGVAL